MKNSSKEIFFHVGLGKTGSTYIQYKFFPKLKGIHYIQRTKYKKSIDIIRNSNHNKYLVSNEFDRALKKEVTKYSKAFPDTKIIMVLRRQDGWIASQYRRFVKNGYSKSFDEFIDLKNDYGEWKQDELYFYPKIKMIENLMNSKPLVLFYDELKNKPLDFFDRIARFINADYNKDDISLVPKHKSYNEKQLKIRRYLNQYFSGHIKESKIRFIKILQKFFIIMPFRYLILSLALIVPQKFVPKQDLIPKKSMDKIKEFYHDDWKQCLNYTNGK